MTEQDKGRMRPPMKKRESGSSDMSGRRQIGAIEEKRPVRSGGAGRGNSTHRAEQTGNGERAGHKRRPDRAIRTAAGAVGASGGTARPDRIKAEAAKVSDQASRAKSARTSDRAPRVKPARAPERVNQARASRANGSGQQSEKRKKKGGIELWPTLLLIVSVCVFVFSAYRLVTSLIPYYEGGKVYADVKKLAIEGGDEKTGFQVDFEKLLSQNKDTVAWIRFDEPKVISYPVVKSVDNEEYLTKTFVESENKLGAIFMDMRSTSDFSDRNTFIYGHNLNIGGEMFSQLLEYKKEDFAKAHPYFYIYTPDGKQRTYQVFSAAVVEDISDNYTLSFESDEAYEKYLQHCKESSLYQVDTEKPLDRAAKIVSLSTCTNVRDEDRFLVQGILVEEAGGAR